MPRFSAVLFDLDGTLIDSIGLIVESFHHTFSVFGLPMRSDVEWLSGIGTPLRSVLDPWAKDPAMLEAMLATYRAYNVAHHDARVRAYAGAAEAVRTLLAAEIPLAVVTSKNRQGTHRGLRAAGLESAIEVLVCAEDVVHHKPHREPVDRALAQLGVRAEEALFVGDSLHDLRAGRAAAVHTGAALWGPFSREDLADGEPSYWLSWPEDVPALVLG